MVDVPEMVERVAKAICKSRTCGGFMCCQKPAQMGRIDCPVKTGGYDEAARAAIEAMREPTQSMLEASWNDVRNAKPDDRMTVLLMNTSMAHRVKTLNRWRAMIDAAIRKQS